MIRVWDPLVRVFHWSLVTAFAVSWFTGDDFEVLHEWAGYAAIALIAIRFVWGFVGSKYARFSQFVRGPGVTLSYIGNVLKAREARYIGHNPAGAAMIVAILITMAGTGYTGWLAHENESHAASSFMLPQFVATAVADSDGRVKGSQTRYDVGDIHELLANLLIVLVVLHVLGVILASIRHRENLIGSMISGEKREAAPGDQH